MNAASVERSASGVGNARVALWGWVLLAAALATATYARWPALHAPITFDDYTQRALIEGKLLPGRSPFGLFDLIANDTRSALLERGAMPWWEAVPGSLLRFLRPIPSLLVWLDFRVAGYDGLVPHALSFAWWAAAVGTAFWLFREFFGARVAVLATSVFALSPAHTVPVLWLANRGVLVTLVLGPLALRFYDRFRTLGQSRDERLALLLFGMTLLTGEYGVCFAAYPLALELLRRDESLGRRLRASLSFVVPVVLYVAARTALGYGVRGPSFYLSPFADPEAFLLAAPRSLAVLAGSLWLGAPDQAVIAAPPVRLLAYAVALGVPLGFALLRTLRRLKGDVRRRALYLALGSVLALLPALAARPSPRLLGPAALGASAVLGLLIERALRPRKSPREAARPATLAVRAVALALLANHLVWVPLEARRFTELAARVEPELAERIDWIRNRLDPSKSTVLVLRAVSAPLGFVAPFMLRDAAPARFRVLCQAYGRLTVVRTGPSTLEVRQDGNEPLVHFGVGDPVRSEPFRAGEVVDVPGMKVTLGSLDPDGLPEALRFDFDRDLDDPSLYVVAEGQSGFSEVFLPDVGYGMHLAP